MIFKENLYKEAFVWIWLPGETEPVVAGKLSTHGEKLIFNYGLSYLDRKNSVSIYKAELPLKSGFLPLLPNMMMPSCLRDAAPDAWGRRVIISRKIGQGLEKSSLQFNELTYFLESGSDRIGALDFQLSPSVYEPRSYKNVSLEELIASAEYIEKGIALPPELDEALTHGTSIGGARPKALIEENHKKYIAKFSSSTDLYNVVKSEFVAMRLAKLSGLNVTPVSLVRASNKDVLLIERFDRIHSEKGWERRGMVSALTLLGLDEMMARYASYEDLAEMIRREFQNASTLLKELFGRITFNILSGNTDDHARNHAAFWDGHSLNLTPAYDICPQNRVGNEASQAMLIYKENRKSQLSVCLDAAHIFLLSQKEALEIIQHQLETITKKWDLVCEEAELSEIDRRFLQGRQFLNPFSYEDLTGERFFIKELAGNVFT